MRDPACSNLVESANAQGISATPAITSPLSVTQPGTAVVGVPVSTMTPSRTGITSTTSFTTRSSTASASSFPPTGPPYVDPTRDAFTRTTCSGAAMDYEAYGTISSLILGTICGSLVWTAWWKLKRQKTLVAVYGARKWFVYNRCGQSWSSLC